MPPIFLAIRKRKVGTDAWSLVVFAVRFLSCETRGLEKAKKKIQEPLGERKELCQGMGLWKSAVTKRVSTTEIVPMSQCLLTQ